MKEDQDAFGKHLLAQYSALAKGEPIAAEIVERDDNYVDFGSTSRMYFSEYEEWSEIERELIDKAKGNVLDVGCGAGRHSLYLQKKGLDTTGIDNSPGAIEVCKKRGLKSALVRPIAEIDKFESNSFDTVLMFGNNFGLFGDPEQARLILEKMNRITTQRAQILAGTLNPYKTDDEAHLKYQERNKSLGRMTGQIRLRVRYRVYIGEWFDYLFVSPEEMETILQDSAWQVRELINSKAARYFAVIEKRTTI